MEITYGGVLTVVAVALLAPVLASRAPRARMPAVAVEILLGIAIGPAGFHVVDMDVPLTVLGTIGLGYLLFLAGLDLDLGLLRASFGRIIASWGLSCAIALVLALGMHAVDVHDSTRLLAIALTATSLGLVVPIVREVGITATPFGQLVLGSCSVAELGSLLLLTLFFSQDGSSTESQLFLLSAFGVMVLLVGLTLARVSRIPSVWSTLDRFADTSSQLAVRAVLVVLLVFLALSTSLGLEAVLGAFVAGALLRFLDRDGHLSDPGLRAKLEAIGYGFLIPIFFVTSGVQVDLQALFASPKHVLVVPAVLVGLLAARGVPALLFRSIAGTRRAVGAGFLQATNLSIIVVIASLGTRTGALDAATAAAMLAAGVLSVMLFPPLAVIVLRREGELEPDWDERPAGT